MDISSYILLSQAQALRRRMDITSNNMANVNTVGFQRERPVFHEYVEQTRSGADAKIPRELNAASFVLDYRAVHDPSQGGFQPTGNPLDVMISGPGYLSLEAPGGGTAYTRAGFVKLNDQGELVSSGGQRILDEGGAPISVPPEARSSLSIDKDGTVNSEQGPLGRIAVTVFDDESGITPRGDGMMNGSGGRVLPAEETKLMPGGVEGSNVQAIVETTQLVDILRSYQTSMKIANDMDEMRKRTLDRLARPG